MNESEVLARAARAKGLIESDVWLEAWDTYRDRIIGEIEAADSSETEKIMQLKRLWVAANAARKHLEALMVDGKVAAKQLEMIQKRPFLKRFG